jgi:hypothetical protein
MRKAPCPCVRACVRVHVRIGGEPEGEGGEETEPWVLNLAPTVLHNCVIRALVPARQMFLFLPRTSLSPNERQTRHSPPDHVCQLALVLGRGRRHEGMLSVPRPPASADAAVPVDHQLAAEQQGVQRGSLPESRSRPDGTHGCEFLPSEVFSSCSDHRANSFQSSVRKRARCAVVAGGGASASTPTEWAEALVVFSCL